MSLWQGKRQEARGKRQEARGKRQEARGKRQEARGKSEEGLSDFTFRYILLFEKPLRVYGFFRSPTYLFLVISVALTKFLSQQLVKNLTKHLLNFPVVL
ncbi:MAG: hypothetical protein HEQ13_13985 [Dolichospermum sp. DEX189]|nr:hypothetical protein [Dolichospermum sp. DEX189]